MRFTEDTNEFFQRKKEREGLYTLLKKIWEKGSTDQRHQSGRTKHARQNVTTVDELVLSQEDQPHGHRSTHQIFTGTGLTQSIASHGSFTAMLV